jgi:uncharacterized protein (DUF924 family)
MDDWTRAVLDFWFGLPPERHWRRDAEVDAQITRRFGPLWREQRLRRPETFLSAAEATLAAIILLDQFPRNMFRGSGRAFSSDRLARSVAVAALDRALDQQVERERRHFFYMPLQHSEALADQERSLALFEALGDAQNLEFARKHHAVIARFGRFPHRNPLLGRESTAEELAFGLETPW